MHRRPMSKWFVIVQAGLAAMLVACGPPEEATSTPKHPSVTSASGADAGTQAPSNGNNDKANGSNAGGDNNPSGVACTTAKSCPKFSCGCGDGTFWDEAQSCLNQACQSQAATCADACKNNGGYGTSANNNNNPVPKKYGCDLTRYSNDYAVTVHYYGSGSTETVARQQAQSNCKAEGWTTAFCTAATMTCAEEAATGFKCTWSKYSNDYAKTITYYGAGDSKTDAMIAAMAQCQSDTWKNWFCASGSFNCSSS